MTWTYLSVESCGVAAEMRGEMSVSYICFRAPASGPIQLIVHGVAGLNLVQPNHEPILMSKLAVIPLILLGLYN